MRIVTCPVVGSWPEDPEKPCGATLFNRETVDKVAPSEYWEISEGGTIDDWESQYGPEEQNSEMAFYCGREHNALQIVGAVTGI